MHPMVLKLIAGLWAYPAPHVMTDWVLLTQEVEQLPSESLRGPLATVLATFQAWDPLEWELHYTQVFDFDAGAALYLTAHELGEDANRGPSLLALKAMIESSGFGLADDQVPDYIPLLLELLAEVPDAAFVPEVAGRLAFAVWRIGQRLDELESPYGALCKVLREVLPAPVEPEFYKLPKNHDPEYDMPFPIRYS